jgi:predicted Zn-dependent peptidase
LFEIFVSAREGFTAEELLAVVDAEIDRVKSEPISLDELARAQARIELGLLQGLTTNEGKASTIGFYEVVLGNPSAAFERLAALSEIRVEQLLEVARRYLIRQSRTVILVRSQEEPPPTDEQDGGVEGDLE